MEGQAVSENQNGGNVMERLTFDGNFCDIAQCTSTPGGSFCEDGSCSARKVWERLKAYEETGLTPEEIDMDHEAAEQLRHLCRGCDLDRLEELAEADKDGRLVVLPCKVGDTVYEVTSRKTISEYRVKAIRVELFCTFIEWDIAAGFVDKSIFGVPVNEIGKTVFLTREEAEKALEAMKDA